MGANTFMTRSRGKTAAEAFEAAVANARSEHGASGHTGATAEKRNFVQIPLPKGKVAGAYAQELIDKGDARIGDRWDPAGCIALDAGEFLFFGWALS